MNYIYSFEKLDVWQKARNFVVAIYKITQEFPKEEKYSLIDQIRRAAISVPSNLAEGTSRISNKDQAHFTNLAYSSLMEVLNHIYIAFDLHYITLEQFDELKEMISEISNKLNSLRKTQLSKDV